MQSGKPECTQSGAPGGVLTCVRASVLAGGLREHTSAPGLILAASHLVLMFRHQGVALFERTKGCGLLEVGVALLE